MHYGYVRSSRGALAGAEQRSHVQAAEPCEILTESEGDKSQPVLARLVESLLPGDTLTVTSLDRLAPSMPLLLTILATLVDRGAYVISLQEDINSRRFGEANHEVSRMLRGVLLAERAFLVERVQTGRAIAQSKGVKLGRRNKLSPDQAQHAQRLLDLGEGGRAVARTFGVSEATLYRYVKTLRMREKLLGTYTPQS